MKYLLLPIASGVLLLLCGCPAQQPSAPASASSHATAPTLNSGATAPTTEKTSTAATSVASPEPPAQQDQTLIAASKKAFDTGMSLYQAGEYQAAREDFDRAVDIFLRSGRDLKSDSVLNDAFEQRVDAINALELNSLQQSNGFSQQEETPVGVANDVTFPVDPNLLARAQADLKITHSDLPLVVNDYVASYINYFTNTRTGHNTIENSLTREGPYRAMVEQVLTNAGMPKDLIYLAVAESGFRPRAVNRRTGAGGMWQFMPHGNYGLARNAWVDERFDPEKSTRAYARYIKELHEQFGDWYLAMAAYDWGPGKVQRAVQRTGYADFWELYQRNVLPAETKELCAHYSGGGDHGEEPEPVWALRYSRRSAAAFRHGDDEFHHQSSPGGGPGGNDDGADSGTESQLVADEHAERFSLRSASAAGNRSVVSAAPGTGAGKTSLRMALPYRHARRHPGEHRANISCDHEGVGGGQRAALGRFTARG